MSTLNKDEIRRRFEKGELIDHPRRNEDGKFDIEPASYDLTAGIVIWKETAQSDNKGSVQTLCYDPGLLYQQQPSVTLKPGQMMFVITHEDVLLPKNLCASVYSRNQLARAGILALNAGHIDPGYCGPIAIRLINLRAGSYTLRLGDPIYTIVFHKLLARKGDELVAHRRISKDETIAKYTESADEALSNALYDLSLTQDFVRKEDFSKAFGVCLKKSVLRVLGWAAATIIFIATLLAAIPPFSDWLRSVLAP